MRPDLKRLLESSYRTVLGRDLRTDAGGDPYDAPAALLMHGIEADPVFCYANLTAQGLWGLTWDEFICLPSRLSAEPLVQTDRNQLLARVPVPPALKRSLPLTLLNVREKLSLTRLHRAAGRLNGYFMQISSALFENVNDSCSFTARTSTSLYLPYVSAIR